MGGYKTPDERVKIRERVASVIASRDEPVSMGELCHLCAEFATEAYIGHSLSELVAAGRITSRSVTRTRRYTLGQSTLPCRVYSHVPVSHTARSQRKP